MHSLLVRLLSLRSMDESIAERGQAWPTFSESTQCGRSQTTNNVDRAILGKIITNTFRHLM